MIFKHFGVLCFLFVATSRFVFFFILLRIRLFFLLFYYM